MGFLDKLLGRKPKADETKADEPHDHDHPHDESDVTAAEQVQPGEEGAGPPSSPA